MQATVFLLPVKTINQEMALPDVGNANTLNIGKRNILNMKDKQATIFSSCIAIDKTGALPDVRNVIS